MAGAQDRLTGSTVGRGLARLGGLVSRIGDRSGATVRERAHDVRGNLLLALQVGVAAGAAWAIMHDVFGAPAPIFAPVAAVGTLAASLGHRTRRTVELVIGVAVGIGVGDLLIRAIGSGPVQLGLIVTLAILVTVSLGGGVAALTQAAATAVLLVAFDPKMTSPAFPRIMEALIGGGVGLVVASLVLPLNPGRAVDRATRPVLESLADDLSMTAAALAERNVDRAREALDRLRRIVERMEGWDEAVDSGRESTILSPAYWNRRRAISRYAASLEYVNQAVHNSGTLVRRAVTAIEDGEPMPAPLASAVGRLGDAVRLLYEELGARATPDRTRACVLAAVADAGRAYGEGVGFSGSVVVAQVRTTASDLLRATGLERTEAIHLVRQAVNAWQHPEQAESPAVPRRQSAH
ncbi:FUSC family protein [Micromonospora sp. NPDC004704]